MGYNVSIYCARSAKPGWMENMQLNRNELCLAQSSSSVPFAGVGPAMMGSVPAAEKSHISVKKTEEESHSVNS